MFAYLIRQTPLSGESVVSRFQRGRVVNCILGNRFSRVTPSLVAFLLPLAWPPAGALFFFFFVPSKAGIQNTNKPFPSLRICQYCCYYGHGPFCGAQMACTVFSLVTTMYLAISPVYAALWLHRVSGAGANRDYQTPTEAPRNSFLSSLRTSSSSVGVLHARLRTSIMSRRVSESPAQTVQKKFICVSPILDHGMYTLTQAWKLIV